MITIGLIIQGIALILYGIVLIRKLRSARDARDRTLQLGRHRNDSYWRNAMARRRKELREEIKRGVYR